MSTPGRNLKSEFLGAVAVLIMLSSAIALAAVLTRDSLGAASDSTPTVVSVAPTTIPVTITLDATTFAFATVTASPTATLATMPVPATVTPASTTPPASPTLKPTAVALLPTTTVEPTSVPPVTATPGPSTATFTAVPPSPGSSATLPIKPTVHPTATALQPRTDTPTERPLPTLTSTPIPSRTPLPPSPVPSATPQPAATLTAVPTTAPTAVPTIVLATPVTPEVYACTPPPGWLPYTIRSGDNLFRLSLRAGIPLQEMQRVNCISNAADIGAGDTLYVPPGFFSRTPISAGSSPAAVSSSSFPVRVGCTAAGSQFAFPAAGSAITGRITITGSATLGDRNAEFSFFKVELRGEGEAGFRNLNQATTPVAAGLLAILNTADFGPGNYQLKLTVVDITGNFIEPCAIRVTFR